VPNNHLGYLGVDSVYRFDQDGIKGGYQINAVDCITQYEGVATCERISEAFLIPGAGSPPVNLPVRDSRLSIPTTVYFNHQLFMLQRQVPPILPGTVLRS